MGKDLKGTEPGGPGEGGRQTNTGGSDATTLICGEIRLEPFEGGINLKKEKKRGGREAGQTGRNVKLG